MQYSQSNVPTFLSVLPLFEVPKNTAFSGRYNVGVIMGGPIDNRAQVVGHSF